MTGSPSPSMGLLWRGFFTELQVSHRLSSGALRLYSLTGQEIRKWICFWGGPCSQDDGMHLWWARRNAYTLLGEVGLWGCFTLPWITRIAWGSILQCKGQGTARSCWTAEILVSGNWQPDVRLAMRTPAEPHPMGWALRRVSLLQGVASSSGHCLRDFEGL